MDVTWFDALTRMLGASADRRKTVQALSSAVLGALAIGTGAAGDYGMRPRTATRRS
jgi:hypothetical protein